MPSPCWNPDMQNIRSSRQGLIPRYSSLNVISYKVDKQIEALEMFTNHEELNSQESTSSLVAAYFRGPDRNHAINGANSYASNNTSTTHPRDVVSRSL